MVQVQTQDAQTLPLQEAADARVNQYTSARHCGSDSPSKWFHFINSSTVIFCSEAANLRDHRHPSPLHRRQHRDHHHHHRCAGTMLMKEYRICMPLTVEEVGELYTLFSDSNTQSVSRGSGRSRAASLHRCARRFSARGERTRRVRAIRGASRAQPRGGAAVCLCSLLVHAVLSGAAVSMCRR